MSHVILYKSVSRFAFLPCKKPMFFAPKFLNACYSVWFTSNSRILACIMSMAMRFSPPSSFTTESPWDRNRNESCDI